MKLRHQAIFFLISLFLGTSNLEAQTEKVETVGLSLDAASISSGGFPFDIPFLMKFPVPKNAKEVKFKYRIADSKKRKKSWVIFPEYDTAFVVKDNDLKKDGWTLEKNTRTWKFKGETEFALKCDGLHPNVEYEFSFEILKSIDVDESAKTKMKAEMLEKIQAFYNNSLANGYTSADLDALQTSLETILKNTVDLCRKGLTLKEVCDTKKDYAIAINRSSTIGKLFDEVFGINDALGNAVGKRNDHIATLLASFQNKQAVILNEISSINSGRLNLTPAAKEALSKPVLTIYDEFKTITLQQALEVLKTITSDQTKLKLFLKGNGKIVNNDILAIPSADNSNNVYFLSYLLYQLNSGVISDIIRGNNNHHLFSGKFDYNITDPLNSIIQAQLYIIKWTAAKNKLIERFPDLSIEIVSSESAVFETISLPDVTTEKTPYISAEGGLGYATSFEQGYSYYGANFYLSPVNKRMKLHPFKSLYYWTKMICINVGTVNFFGNRPKNTYSILGEGSNSDLALGIGLRTSRFLKFNFNWLPYKTDNNNPLLDKKEIKADFLISMGIDLNLLGAFSNVAKALKLLQ